MKNFWAKEQESGHQQMRLYNHIGNVHLLVLYTTGSPISGVSISVYDTAHSASPSTNSNEINMFKFIISGKFPIILTIIAIRSDSKREKIRRQ